MSTRTYTVFLRGKDLKITDTQLLDFRRMFMEPSDLDDRMSELLWLDLYVYDAEMGVSPHDVLTSIKSLEDGRASSVKPATQFRNQPLKGLWHQHYFSAQFLIQNIQLGFGKRGLEELVDEVMDPAKSNIMTPDMIKELAHRAVHDPIEKRASSKKLTGEWIIFLKRDMKNYYLCCNTHSAGDQQIYDRIIHNCVRDFPDLISWLKEAAI